ncbi:hypothetical protein F5148DRAFT_850432 [Russula earlei]|uniref:Uncharacterized protein n=1 Tax=Russula earlei TaxID=71964 RepID=A0ACC0ULE9_9AGAM|nr:hypothetical protein F5148DRAFT_850432 [Russula earlei]
MRDHAELAPAFEVLLAVGGQCGLPILVLTSLRSRRVNPSSTFVNLCLTLIIHSLVFCLLIYTGQNDGRQVNRALCVSQAAMIMGILPTVCTAALMVVLQTWATFQDPGSAIFVAFERPHVRFMLLAAPYITFLGYMLGSILVATSRPDSALAMNGLFCTFHLEAIWHFLTPLSCLVLLIVMTALEAVIVVRWYRQWYY